MKLFTIRRYDFFEVSSSMQKAIRRADIKLAGYFALELYASNFALYVWKRLMVISAEDCAGILTKEIWALYEGFELVNKGKKGTDDQAYEKGRIFISKAVILLCNAIKDRDSDHLQNLVYDQQLGVTDQEIKDFLNLQADTAALERLAIPEYAFDVHTQKGRKAGKTKKQFFAEEFAALSPAVEKDLFGELIPLMK